MLASGLIKVSNESLGLIIVSTATCCHSRRNKQGWKKDVSDALSRDLPSGDIVSESANKDAGQVLSGC